MNNSFNFYNFKYCLSIFVNVCILEFLFGRHILIKILYTEMLTLYKYCLMGIK